MKNLPTFQQEVNCWTRRYEQLREQVLAGDSSIATDCRGLALLIRQGVIAWMRAWHDPLCRCAANTALGAEALPMRLTETWQQEATRLLVNMALSYLRPRACNS
ncbi:MAG: hypothetical protein JO251_07815 [Verrucomicrobia bacterium]|jgi:hypothetical protein|nr:hypothetical protein [Verrucomicrobiota bacterium]